jgi:RNA polymerase sigma-70 factor (ECF subfamily)
MTTALPAGTGPLEVLPSLPAKRDAWPDLAVRRGAGAAPPMEIFGNDQGLLRRFREGDRDALGQVYWAYVERVEALLYRRLSLAGGTSASDLEDLVQEVFVRAFASDTRLGYDGLRPFAPYLLSIARNTLVDWWRRRGRQVPTALSLDEVPEAVVAAEESPGSYADARTVAVVERFVRALPPELRAVHEARFDRGLSQRDAALALGIGRQVLRTLERRLTDQLREALADDLDGAVPAERRRNG